MRKVLTALTLIAAALYAADPARDQTLQRAIDLMESKGDLAKAMPLFEDAARSADKAVAARALLYLGQGQERQGAEKARATYERIVKEFGNQTETVAAARKRLAAIGAARPSQTLTKSLLCGECGDVDADFSPDGRYMLVTEWEESGDLAIRDMSTGQLRRLMVKPNSWKESDAYAEAPILSQDQRQIAFLWETGEKEHHAQLRLTANQPGSKPRVLVDNPENNYYTPVSWSADGKSILTLIEKVDRTWQLGWISVSDGSTKVLKSLEWRRRGVRDGGPSLSPDGRYIAYAALATNPTAFGLVASTDERIYVLAADGSSETELMKTAGINENPVWTPDGRHLLFTSNRSGNFGIWSVAMQDGKAAGTPSQVLADTGKFFVHGVLRSGAYYYSTASVAVETIGVLERGATARTAGPLVGIQPVWSPDGKLLALNRHRSVADATYDLVVHSLETGEETVYVFPGLAPAPPTWSQDGKALVVLGNNSGTMRSFYRVDLKTKEFKQLLEVDTRLFAPLIYALSPDGKTLYVGGRPESGIRINRIVAFDLATGREKTVVTFPPSNQPNFMIKLSPNGRTLAINRRDSETQKALLARVATDGSDFRQIHTFDGPRHLEWTPDGSGVLFLDGGSNVPKVMRIPAEGGKVELPGFEVPRGLQNISLSPDGKRLTFSSRWNVRELWAIDNLLSVVK